MLCVDRRRAVSRVETKFDPLFGGQDDEQECPVRGGSEPT